MTRVKNWFTSYNDARKAASERRELKHMVAKVMKKGTKKVVGYYTGRQKFINNLKGKYDISVY